MFVFRASDHGKVYDDGQNIADDKKKKKNQYKMSNVGCTDLVLEMISTFNPAHN